MKKRLEDLDGESRLKSFSCDASLQSACKTRWASGVLTGSLRRAYEIYVLNRMRYCMSWKVERAP